MLILIPKSASNFTPTVLNHRRKRSTVNHLFSGSQGPYSHVYLQLHVMYTVSNHIYIYIYIYIICGAATVYPVTLKQNICILFV